MVSILGIMVYCLFLRSPEGIVIEEFKDKNEKKIKIKNEENGEFDKDRQKAIENLRLFALEKMEKEKKNNKSKGSPGEVLVNGQGTGPVANGKEYIPYHLNEKDKMILRMFNES